MFDDKVLEEVGAAISPIAPLLQQQEAIARHREILVRELTSGTSIPTPFAEAAIAHCRTYASLLKCLIAPVLSVKSREDLETLDVLVRDKGEGDKIEEFVDFNAGDEIPLIEFLDATRDTFSGLGLGFEHTARAYCEEAKRRIEAQLPRIAGRCSRIKSLSAEQLAALRAQPTRETVLGVLQALGFFQKPWSADGLTDDAVTRIPDLMESVAAGRAPLRSYAVLLHLLRGNENAAGEFLAVALMSIPGNLREFFKTAPHFARFLVLGFYEELLNHTCFELCCRDGLTFSLEVAPQAYVRRCVLRRLTVLEFSRSLREFWHLVRAGRLAEDELQRFLAANPRFLLGSHYTYLYEKLRLKDADGTILIPDFVVVRPDRGFDIVELKRPDLKRFIVGPPGRERFSHHVQAYLQQARAYRRWFEQNHNREWFQGTYGNLRLRVLQPEISLIVGRRDEVMEAAAYNRLRSEVQDVRIKTYSELYEEADLLYQRMSGA